MSPNPDRQDAHSGRHGRREQTPEEEIANTVTHGVGLMLSCACLALGVVFAALRGDPWIVVSVSVYGATLCLLYLSSTLYHGTRDRRAKHFWNILDHSAIYLLIAGTYTPLTLGPLRTNGAWGWTLFGVVWALAIAGIVFQALFIHRHRIFSTVTYLAMGWLVLIAIRPLWHELGPRGFVWIALGGACYSLGIFFYAGKRLPFAHAVWHLFVLVGSMLHFLGILLHVVLPPAG